MPEYAIPAELQRRISAHGAEVSGSREISDATQYRLSSGSQEATLNVYRTGKVLEGGKESALKAVLRDYRTSGSGKAGSRTPRKKATKSSPTPVPNSVARVGTDEAGKGEYFGPLVVAGVRVRGAGEDAALRTLGVRDSKDLSPSRARELASEIVSVVGERDVQIICLSPREYEKRRDRSGENVNRLLGELNVEVISTLREDIEKAVVDAFGVKAAEYVRAGDFGNLEIEARPRAEDDAAVAAASILARSRYLEEMDRLSEEVGFDLPRGSSDVLRAARRVYESSGEDGLRDVAKFHFSTTRNVISA